MTRFTAGLMLSTAIAWFSGGCASTALEAQRPVKAGRSKVAQPPAVPAFHWEPLEVSVDPSIERRVLPLAQDEWLLLGGASERLVSLPQPARDAIATRGFAVIERDASKPTYGEAYRALDAREVPILVTLDSLVEVTHLAVETALAEVDATTIEPALRRLLASWTVRLEALVGRTPTDLARPLRYARGIVAVAAALLDGDAAKIPADLAPFVRDEVRRARELFPAAPSVLLDVPLDYGAIVGTRSESRSPMADALGWLSLAPLVLVGRDASEASGGTGAGVAVARDHTRAALLFAHVTSARVDPRAAADWARVDALETFLLGPGDDWSPAELGDLATREGVDLTNVASFVDVARIDRIRRLVGQSQRARIHDGGGSLSGVRMSESGQRFVARFMTPTVRVMSARLGLDAIVQQAMVAPVVGAYRGDRTVVTLAGGKRTLSRPLDFAIVLGSEEARAALKADGDDAYDELDATLRKLVERRPPEREATRHASVYLSLLDLVGVLLSPSAADAAIPASATVEHRRRMLESGLAAYATVRHDFTTRVRVGEKPQRPEEGRVGKAPRVFVEPHPEAIGRMVSLVRQLARGLAAYKTLDEGRTAMKVVSAAERLLTAAFQAALLTANGIAPNDDQTRALAAMPEALGAIERATGSRASRAVDMHVDIGSGRVLTQGTGKLAELAILVRDPKDGKLVLCFGPAVTHHELVHVRQEVMSDAEWRTRLERGALPRASWTASYRFR